MSINLKLNKSTLYGTIILLVSIVYLTLSQYAPQREFLYSNHAFAILFLSVFLLGLLHFSREFRLYVPYRLHLVGAYSLSLILIIMPTALNLGGGEVTFGGAVNNVIYQLVFIVFLIFYASWFKLDNKRLTHHFAVALLIFSLFSAFAGFQLYFTGGVLFGPLYFEDSRWPQLYGFYQSPNFFINSIGLGIFSSIYLFYDTSKASRIRKLNFIYLTFLSLAAVLSGSKGGILFIVFSIVISSVLVFLNKLSGRALRKAFKVVFTVFLFFMLLLVSVSYYLEYIGLGSDWLFSSVIRVQSASTGTGRFDLWAVSLEILDDASWYQLLFGHGNDYIIANFGSSTHNDHLKVIVEYGVLAFFILILIFIFAVFKLLTLSKKYNFEFTVFLLSCLMFAWFRPFLQSGLFSAGLLGFSYLFVLFIIGYKNVSN